MVGLFISFTYGNCVELTLILYVSCRRLELAGQLKQWHLKVIEIVKRGQHRKSLDKLFQGFKPAVESCYFNWEVAYPLDGITYCSADKKSATFCWSRAVQHQRGVKAAAGGGGEPPEPGGGGRTEGGTGGDYKGRGGAHSSQQEVAVRPKETILTKRKGLSVSGGGGMLVRLGGSVSLSLEDGGGKCMYKGPGSSSGGKLKLTQGGGKGASVGGPGGGGGLGGGKHASAKRRTSSEDSSLEPDLAELSLDDGCNLALGAEASNTFEFLPPPPEMLPSPSPLLRDSRKYSGSGGSKMFETKRVNHSSSAVPAAEPAPPCFPPKETVLVVMDVPSAAEKEAELEVEPDQNRDEDIDSAEGNQPSNSTSTARSGANQTSGKPPRSRREAAAAGAPPNQGAEAAVGAAGGEGGEALGEDDYQAYYLSAASEEGAERHLNDNHQEEEPDIFAGIKPLEQEGRMEVGREGREHVMSVLFSVRFRYNRASPINLIHKIFCILHWV